MKRALGLCLIVYGLFFAADAYFTPGSQLGLSALGGVFLAAGAGMLGLWDRDR